MLPPPAARQTPHVHLRHGLEVPDPWHWLSDRNDPGTVPYLEAENAYAEQFFDSLAELRETIFTEIRTRTQETDLTVPVTKGAWSYYTRTVEGLDYPIHCRRPAGDPDGPEQVMLDENQAAQGTDYFALGVFDVSPDGHRLAWAADLDGSERHTLLVRDLASDLDLEDRIEGVYYGSAWSSDGSSLFYVRTDEAMRPYQVWRHDLGHNEDTLVFTEADESFYVGLGLTRSEGFVVISSASKTSSETWLIPADDPRRAPQVVAERTGDHEYDVDHQGDRLLILTNDAAEDFRVMETPVHSPGRAHWRELVAHEPGTRISDLDAFEDFVVLSEWSGGTERLRILHDDGRVEVLGFDEPVHSVFLGSNPQFATRSLRLGYQSMTTPASVLQHDLDTGSRQVLKQTPVLGGVDLTRYRAERHWATSADGTQVPYDLMVPTDRDVSAVLLYGYGSYEVSVPPYFSIPRLCLLDRGVAFALAHPRGGGEMGRQWYLDGKLEHKRHTFEDYVACGEDLAARGLTVVIRGGSAGGLLVGAAMTMRPDLFAAVVAEVPFVDVLTTMLDESMPLTITEWEEWGNPNDRAMYDYMATYSPYDNVAPVDYPALYATAGFNDPRVSYHEPAKWVAKLRAISTGTRPILLRTELGAGHGGPTGRYDEWRDEARVLAFVLWAAGLA